MHDRNINQNKFESANYRLARLPLKSKNFVLLAATSSGG